MSPEQRVPSDHPLRPIRSITDRILQQLSSTFARIYSSIGRPSIAPEKLLRALLLQIFFTIRSERMLMEQLEYNLLFRWFVGLNMDDAVWDATVYSKNRDRLLEADVAQEFFRLVLEEAKGLDLVSDEHFTVDGTLLEACASLKSFKKVEEKDAPPADDPGNPTVDFHGEKRSNETHCSTTDADALLARKGTGKEAKLSYAGHVLMENRNGLVIETMVTQANGTAERDAALLMAEAIPGYQRVTLGADKNYRYEGELRQLTVMELGNEEPTVLLTNHRKLGPVELVTRYAQRMLIENGISEAVQFFHIDALSSMVGMKVDFDMRLTLVASSLYRMMAQRIGREYSHPSQAKTVFRNLLDLSGKVEVTATSVVVTLDKRAHNPYLVASGLADQPTPMPWFGDKKLIIQFA